MKTKLLSAIAAIAITATLLAQSQTSPVPVGNTATLAWEANPEADGVTLYSVYRISGTTNKVYTTTGTSAPLVSLLPAANGTYALYVTATNPAGESSPSTNIWVRYWFNKPTAPKGLLTK